jgi:hypothetical protein
VAHQANSAIDEITPPVKGILKITWLEHRFLEKGSGLLSNPEILDGSAILRVVTLRVKENLREMLDIKDVELPVFKIEPQM